LLLIDKIELFHLTGPKGKIEILKNKLQIVFKEAINKTTWNTFTKLLFRQIFLINISFIESLVIEHKKQIGVYK
jgi:hypothetical protein